MSQLEQKIELSIAEALERVNKRLTSLERVAWVAGGIILAKSPYLTNLFAGLG